MTIWVNPHMTTWNVKDSLVKELPVMLATSLKLYVPMSDWLLDCN